MLNAVGKGMADILSRSWWVLLLRGLAAIVFAFLTWTQPGISLTAMVLLFGAYALADGVLAVWTAIAGRAENDDWWMVLIAGLVGIGIGILTFASPGLTALALLFYIAVWAIAKGGLEIVAAIRLRKVIRGEIMMILAGLASILFGVLMLSRPGAGALAVLWLIAAYAFVFGLLTVVLAFRVKGIGKKLAAAAGA